MEKANKVRHKDFWYTELVAKKVIEKASDVIDASKDLIENAADAAKDDEDSKDK